MFLLSSDTPRYLRLIFYFISEVKDLAKNIVRTPTSRSAYGRLLNLPRFGVIQPGAIYRSGEPRQRAHFRHVQQLGIRTMLCVRRTPPNPRLLNFVKNTGITLYTIDLGHPKLRERAVERAHQIAANPSMHPILVHCDGGRHRAGIIAASLRMDQGWQFDAIIAEYLRFVRPSPFWDHLEFIALRMANCKVKRSVLEAQGSETDNRQDLRSAHRPAISRESVAGSGDCFRESS